MSSFCGFSKITDLLYTALSDKLLHSHHSPVLTVIKAWKGVVFFPEKRNGFIITWLRCVVGIGSLAALQVMNHCP